MIYVKSEYKVKKEKIDEIKEAIKEFVDEVKKNESNTLLYEAFQKDNGNTFVHLMRFKDESSEEIHRKSPYVMRFVNRLYQNCEKEPVFTRLSLIRSTKRN